MESRKFFARAGRETTGSQLQMDNNGSREGPEVAGEWDYLAGPVVQL